MFKPIHELMGHAANRFGISTEVEAAKVCHAFRVVAPKVMGNEEITQEHVDAGHFKMGVLVVNVESPAFAQEVITRKARLIDEVNTKMGREVVKNLRTQLK